ncbi:MAG TPA: translation initiation factor IF-3 [Acidobacteriota bacterium]|nr:translation initiation factor IF-3 [Acidobacteriota bacterium]
MRKYSGRRGRSGPRVRVNRQIRSREIRAIDSDGTQLGIMHPKDAYKIAQDKGLDLVEVAPNAKPPVCRILDYGKYMYQQSKRAQEAKKHQKQMQVKEVKFRPKTDQHDYDFKKKHIIRFIEDENKVKCTIMFRGREVTHPEAGRDILEQLKEELEDLVDVEREPKLEGYNMTMMLIPKKDKS